MSVLIGPFVTTSSVTVGGNFSSGGDTRLAGTTTVTGDLLVGGNLVFSAVTLSVGGVTLSGNVSVVGLNGIDVSADTSTNTLTISGASFPSAVLSLSDGITTLSGNITLSSGSNITIGLCSETNTITISAAGAVWDGNATTDLNMNTSNILNVNLLTFVSGGGTISDVTTFTNGGGSWNFSNFGTNSNLLNIGATTGALSNTVGSSNTIGGLTIANGGIFTTTSTAPIARTYSNVFPIITLPGAYTIHVGNVSNYASGQPLFFVGRTYAYWSNLTLYSGTLLPDASLNLIVTISQTIPGDPIDLVVSNTQPLGGDPIPDICVTVTATCLQPVV
jgi:hypothetical protein